MYGRLVTSEIDDPTLRFPSMPTERDEARASERHRLFDAYAADPSEANRNAIVESFVPLALDFAGRHGNSGADDADLRQVAMLALVKAVDRFDPAVGVKFSTLAGRTIDGEIKRCFRDATWSVRVPRSLQERSLEVRALVDEISLRLGSSPTVDQIAEVAGLGPDEVIEALDVQQSYRAASLDSGRPTAGGPSRAAVRALATTDVEIERFDTKLAIRELLETLPERERVILELRFDEQLSHRDRSAGGGQPEAREPADPPIAGGAPGPDGGERTRYRPELMRSGRRDADDVEEAGDLEHPMDRGGRVDDAHLDAVGLERAVHPQELADRGGVEEREAREVEPDRSLGAAAEQRRPQFTAVVGIRLAAYGTPRAVRLRLARVVGRHGTVVAGRRW